MTSLLVASGIGVVGVVPALAASDSSAPAAVRSDDDRDHGGGHGRWFRDRGDVRYVWFRVCDTTATATTATTAPEITSETLVPDTTTETVAPDAVAAAIEGAATETATVEDTATATDTVTDTTTDTTITEPTTEPTTVDDDADSEVYPTFIVVPLPKDEAKALRKLDERPCYDLTTGAPATTTDTTTTTPTDTTTETTPVTETATPTPVDTGVTG